jgi:4a-hydroxytetrahydrobiopterin dehydratase
MMSATRLDDVVIDQRLRALDGWRRDAGDKDRIAKTYRFADHYQTLAFVNALAWISHRQDHHPDLTVGYNQCTVAYTTHSAGGLSDKDFLCAAKVDALFAA